MPFKSEAQRRWMYANKPEMAKRWQKETPMNTKLPKTASALLGRLLTKRAQDSWIGYVPPVQPYTKAHRDSTRAYIGSLNAMNRSLNAGKAPKDQTFTNFTGSVRYNPATGKQRFSPKPLTTTNPTLSSTAPKPPSSTRRALNTGDWKPLDGALVEAFNRNGGRATPTRAELYATLSDPNVRLSGYSDVARQGDLQRMRNDSRNRPDWWSKPIQAGSRLGSGDKGYK